MSHAYQYSALIFLNEYSTINRFPFEGYLYHMYSFVELQILSNNLIDFISYSIPSIINGVFNHITSLFVVVFDCGVFSSHRAFDPVCVIVLCVVVFLYVAPASISLATSPLVIGLSKFDLLSADNQFVNQRAFAVFR